MKTPIFQWTTLDKIYKALKIYNNGYASEWLRNEAFDLLQDIFSDQLGMEREEEMAERWYTEEEIESMRWTSTEIEWRIETLANLLDPIWF